MRLALVATISLLCAALAGCAESPGEPGEESEVNPPASSSSDGAVIDAPEWTIGQYWVHNTPDLDESGEYTYVVTAEEGDDWIVETDNAEVAFFDARYDISHMGPVRKADLAGSQGEKRIEMFDFPLFFGKSWETGWDGYGVQISVERVTDGTAELVAMWGDILFAEYNFVSEIGWYQSAVFYDVATGETSFQTQVVSSGNSWSGDIASWQYEDAWCSGDVCTSSVTISPENTDVYLEYSIECTSGRSTLTLVAVPPGVERWHVDGGECPYQASETLIFPAPTEGSEDWILTVTGGSFIDYWLAMRTLQLTPFG